MPEVHHEVLHAERGFVTQELEQLGRLGVVLRERPLECGADLDRGRVTAGGGGRALHDLDPVFDAFSRTPELAAVAGDIGLHSALLLQSMYIFKQPRIGGEVSCHTDHTYLWTEPRSVVGFWFAIDDATTANGCMWALPGGHRLPVKSRSHLNATRTATVMEHLDSEPYPTEGLVPLEAKRGTLVLLDGALPHRSGPNHSDTPRHAYTVHVIDGSARYLEDNWLQRPTLPLRGFGNGTRLD